MLKVGSHPRFIYFKQGVRVPFWLKLFFDILAWSHCWCYITSYVPYPNGTCAGLDPWCTKQFWYMALDNVITSPHRRSQTQTAFSPPSPRRQHSRGDELGSCSTLVRRHRFLLTALALLAFLCTIYLYFAVTLGSTDECSGLTGAQQASCRVQQSKVSAVKGKLKFF